MNKGDRAFIVFGVISRTVAVKVALFSSSSIHQRQLSSSIYFNQIKSGQKRICHLLCSHHQNDDMQVEKCAPSHQFSLMWSEAFRWNEWWTDTDDGQQHEKMRSWKVSIDTCLASCNAYGMQCKRNNKRVAVSTPCQCSPFIAFFSGVKNTVQLSNVIEKSVE